MTKNHLSRLLNEFVDLNKQTDVESASKLCIVLMYLQKIGYGKLAELLSEQKHDDAREYIERLEC